MATSLGEIFVRIGAKTKEFDKALDNVQRRSAKVFAGVAAAIGGIGVIGAGFEKEIAKVGALTGATGEKFAQMGKVARSVAKETEFTAAQAAEGMSFFAMAGYSAEQSMAALRPATVLATTGFMDLGTAADVVTNVMSGMGVGFDELDKSIDVLVATASSANTTVAQLGEAFSYAGPVLKSFGISFEAGAAAMGILSDAGIQASRAGTNLRMVITKLAKPTGEAAAIMKRLGVQSMDASGKMLPLDQIFGRLAKSGATAKDMITMFGPRAASAAMILTESMKSGEKSLASFTEQLEKSGGKSEEIFQRMSQTTAFQFNVLKSNTEEAALVMWDQFKPAVNSAIEAGQIFAQAIAQVDDKTLALIADIAVFTAGLSGAILAFSTLGKVGVAALGSLSLPAIAIAALVTLLIMKFDSLRSVAKDLARDLDVIVNGASSLERKHRNLLTQSMRPGFGGEQGPGVAGSIVGTMGEITAEIKSGMSGILKEVGFTFDNTDKEVDELNKMLDDLKKNSSKASTGLDRVAQSTKNIGGKSEYDFSGNDQDFGIGGVIDELNAGEESLKKMWAKYEALHDQHLNDVSSYQNEIIEKMAGEAEARDAATISMSESIDMTGDIMWGAAQRMFSKMGAIGSIIQAGIQGMMSGGPIGAIVAVIMEIVSMLENFQQATDMANDGLYKILDAINPLFEVLVTVSDFANEFLDGILGAIGPILKTIGDLINNVFGAILSAFEPIFKLITNLFSIFATVLEPVVAMFSGLAKMAGSLIQFMSVFDMIGPIFEALAGAIQGFGNAFNGVVEWFDRAASDIDYEFSKLKAWFEKEVGIRRELTDEEKRIREDQIDVLKSQLDAFKQFLDVINASGQALQDFNKSMTDFIAEELGRQAMRNMDPSAITSELGRVLTSGLDAQGIQNAIGEMFEMFTGAGLSQQEAEALMYSALEGFTGSDFQKLGSAMDVIINELVDDVLPNFVDGADDAADGVTNLGNAANEAAESLLNIPSGFKLEQLKFDAINSTPSVPSAGGAQAGSGAGEVIGTQNNSINIQTLQIMSDDPDDMVRKIEARRRWQNVNSHGTTIDATGSLAGRG